MPEGRLATSDPEVARIIDLEVDRQRHGLELIASENFVSPAVLEAMGTPLTNKYAEGLPGKRYYGGCEFVDMVEQLAIDRLKQLFSADHDADLVEVELFGDVVEQPRAEGSATNKHGTSVVLLFRVSAIERFWRSRRAIEARTCRVNHDRDQGERRCGRN